MQTLHISYFFNIYYPYRTSGYFRLSLGMQNLHQKLTSLEQNVKGLIRKLMETKEANENLQQENNKLKQELSRFEESRRAEIVATENSKTPHQISGDEYQHIKSEIKSCISEIDACIDLVTK